MKHEIVQRNLLLTLLTHFPKTCLFSFHYFRRRAVTIKKLFKEDNSRSRKQFIKVEGAWRSAERRAGGMAGLHRLWLW